MGLKCKIHRDVNGSIIYVEAINGEFSNLYKDALNFTKDEQSALDIWSVAYSSKFKDIYGDFEKGADYIDLDSNGEPTLSTVLDFLFTEQSSTNKLSDIDIYDLNNTMIGRPHNSVSDFYKDLTEAYFNNDRFFVNKVRLENSGLYTPVEIENILNDSDLQSRIYNYLTKMSGSLSMSNDFDNIDKDIVGSSGISEELLLVNQSEITDLGFMRKVNPSDIYNNIVGTVGGVKSRSEFDNMFNSIRYPSLVERYLVDASFADYMFEKYSSLDAIPVLDINRSSQSLLVTKKNSSEYNITSFFRPNQQKINSISEVINELSSLRPGEWMLDEKDIKILLGSIERLSASMGIDLIGLSEKYDNRSQDEIVDMLTSYDTFLHSDFSDLSYFSSNVDNVFDYDRKEATEKITLPERLKGLNIFSIKNGIADEQTMYSNFGLIKVDQGLYHKVDNSLSTDQLYDVLLGMSIENPSFVASEAYYPAAFTKGKLDADKLRDPKLTSQLKESLKRYVSQRSLSEPESMEKKEDVILNRMIFQHGPLPTSDVNVADIYNRHNAYDGNIVETLYSFPEAFHGYILSEKMKDSEVYKRALRYFNFDGMYISLGNVDMYEKKAIESFIPEGKIKTQLKNYVYISNDSSFDGLFTIDNDTSGIPEGKFYSDLYVNHPQLLDAFKGVYNKSVETGIIEVQNSPDLFIKVNGDVYVKIGEANDLSYYEVAGYKNISNMDTFNNEAPKSINFANKNLFSNFGRASFIGGSISSAFKSVKAINDSSLLDEIRC